MSKHVDIAAAHNSRPGALIRELAEEVERVRRALDVAIGFLIDRACPPECSTGGIECGYDGCMAGWRNWLAQAAEKGEDK